MNSATAARHEDYLPRRILPGAYHRRGGGFNPLLPPDIRQEIGHFNLFNVADLVQRLRERPVMPYNRRAYYKISLVRGRNQAQYADKVIEITHSALLFATPKVPYHWVPQDLEQAGYFCVFTAEFLQPAKSGVALDELPLFQAGSIPVFEVDEAKCAEIEGIFKKMEREITSSYAYKYDLLRTYVLELIHCGQKLQPAPGSAPEPHRLGAGRVPVY
ncbi:MAG: hypothetical protein WKG07_02445 [Hymenobacter sp.]